MCMSVLSQLGLCSMFVPVICETQRRALDSPRTGVIDDCDLLCGCWKSNTEYSAKEASVLNH